MASTAEPLMMSGTNLDVGSQIAGAIERLGTIRDVVSPTTLTVVGSVALASAEDLDRAVAVARGAQKRWCSLSAFDRRAQLQAAASMIRSRAADIASLIALEQGKPLVDGRKEVLFGADVIEFYADEALRMFGEIRPSANPAIRSFVERRPYGIVGAITPWNYPVDLWCWKVGGALAAANAVIVKPPVETPLSIVATAQAMFDSGLDPALIANLFGDADLAVALIGHPAVQLVSVTASTTTGQHVMRAAADTLTPVLLELGGQAPFIVTADADVITAAQAATRRSFSNMGQICVAVNRILVENAIADEFVAAMASCVERIELGDPTLESTTFGPVTTEGVANTTTAHIDDALASGATLVVGKRQPRLDRPGRFVQPVVLDNVPPTAIAMNYETFGPLAAVQRLRNVDELVAEANRLPAGLAAYVYGGDLERSWALAERLEFGMVGVNVNDATELMAPFGGWKMSGFGSELGREGLLAYSRPRHLRIYSPTFAAKVVADAS